MGNQNRSSSAAGSPGASDFPGTLLPENSTCMYVTVIPKISLKFIKSLSIILDMHTFTGMTKEYFEGGLDIPAYMQELKNYRSLVRRLMKEASAEGALADMVKKKTARFHPPLRASALTEDWCGDWACNLPVLTDLFGKTGIEFRVFRGSENPELKKYYEEDGDDHIPAVSIWDGGGTEIMRWIEAPEKVQEMKTSWKTEHPELMILYGKKENDKDAARNFARLYRTFLEDMAVWYAGGMWQETVREIAAGIEEPSLE